MNTLYEYISNGKYIAASLANANLLPEGAAIIRTNTEEGLKDSPEYQAHLAEQQAAKLEVTKAQLWKAATSYRSDRIAIEAIVELKPYEQTHTKAGEIRLWIQGIWSLYYQKKAELEQGKSASLDFSELGEMPHSFLEAMAEIEEN